MFDHPNNESSRGTKRPICWHPVVTKLSADETDDIVVRRTENKIGTVCCHERLSCIRRHMPCLICSTAKLQAFARYIDLQTVMTVPANSQDDKYTQFGNVDWRLGRHMMIVGVKDSRAVGEG
jgi:hypothetical protein